MFKKVIQAVTAFGILLVGYSGYVRIFALVASAMKPAVSVHMTPVGTVMSKTKIKAINLAASAFGPGHWSANKDLAIRYYNNDRGYWMNAKTYERLNDGKRLVFRPFALIWESKDGKELKTATSDIAVIDLDKPLGLASKSDAPLKVIHARLEGDVRIRDDKATATDLTDDLVVGPMPYIEYDEASLQITSDSDVPILDRDMRITGTDLMIQLRPKDETVPGGGGFNGAKSATLRRNVHVVLNDAGPSGILPGPTKPGAATGAKTPLDVRCSGPMIVELPKPRAYPPGFVGPPAPPAPTLVYFARDVVAQNCKPNQLPDQLNCDNLRLTLVPAASVAKPGGAGRPKAPKPAPGTEEGTASPGGDLVLRRADATGHAVWLQSKADGMTARCNELIQQNLLPQEPNNTYLRGDRTTKLWIQKLDIVQEGPDKGKVQGVNTIRTIDATIFQNGEANDNSTIVARGPGILETRPAIDKPVERTAIWNDHMIVQTKERPDGKHYREITLTGRPELIDPAQGTLDARKRIVIFLTPKPAAAATAAAAGNATTPMTGGMSGSFQIEKLMAQEDVHLLSPGKTMTARERLDAEFVPAPPTAATSRPAAPATAVAANGAPSPNAPAQAGPAAPKTDAAAKPAEPDVVVKANLVWAQLITHPEQPTAQGTASQPMGGTSRSEMKEVRLRGAVTYHQDAAPDKERGTDVTGEAIDVRSLGEGKSFLQVDSMSSRNAKTSGTALALAPHARVETEDMTITGPQIGLNQKTDRAWVEGPGTMLQMPKSDTKDAKAADKPKDRDEKRKAAEKPKRPQTISWKTRMQFAGRSEDLDGKPAAKALFYGDVRAFSDDSVLACRDHMEVYMDKTVALVRPKGEAKPAGESRAEGDTEPQAQIALVRCFGNVVVVSRSYDVENPKLLVKKQQIESDTVYYDKLTGDFLVPGAGRVLDWNRDGPGSESARPGGVTPTSRIVIPTASARASTRRPATTIGRSTGPGPRNGSSPSTKGRTTISQEPVEPPLKQTLITFSRSMEGRYLAGKDAENEIRWADFFGDVQALNAKVPNEDVQLDFDRPPPDYLYLTAQKMRLISEPKSESSNAARNFLKAWDQAEGRTRTETIKADMITYDTEKELSYALGLDGHEVSITQQTIPSQPATYLHGSSLMHNRKTGESNLHNPREVQAIDVKTGIRPGAAPDPKIKRPKSTRSPLRMPGRTTTERKGFIGK